MFVVIAAEERPEGESLPARLWRRMSAGRVRAEEKSFRGCSYWLLTIRDPRHPPYKKLRAMAGRAAGKVVAGRGILLPPGCGLTAYRPALFQARVAVAAAAQVLEALGPGKAQVAGVSDPQGLHPWCCRRLLERCGLLRVYTQRPQRYEAEAERLMEETGALVLLTDDPGTLSSCVLCVALSGDETEIRVPAPVLAAEGIRAKGRPTAAGLELTAWEEEEDWLPPEVDPGLFLGAAMELSARPPAAELWVDACRIDGRAAPLEDLVLFIDQRLREGSG